MEDMKAVTFAINLTVIQLEKEVREVGFGTCLN